MIIGIKYLKHMELSMEKGKESEIITTNVRGHMNKMTESIDNIVKSINDITI